MSSVFYSAIARISHHLPSKRKLDDYAPLSSSDPLSDPLTMRSSNKPSVSSSSWVPSSSSAPSTPSPSSSSFLPISWSPSTLHFFVRTDSRTLVLHCPPYASIKSVMEQIGNTTGVPITPADHRIIYQGRQLDPDSTLAFCSVVTDASLHLTARLRSTRFPRAWQFVQDVDNSVSCLLANIHIPREISSIDSVLTHFLASVPTGTHGEIEDSTHEYLNVFVLGCAPASLVRLYLSHSLNNRMVAERTIRLFLNPMADFLPKHIHVQCWPIVLEFCKLILGTKGRSDGLYISCRRTLASLLEAPGAFCGGGGVYSSKIQKLVMELFPYVKELAENTAEGLLSDNMFISPSELNEFSSFLVVMRRAVREWMEGGSPIPKSPLGNGAHPRHGQWVYSLHFTFINLLGKVDACLKKVESFLADKGEVKSDARWAAWSHILVVLTNVHSFSKIYEGTYELLRAVLLNRRSSVNALIRHAKKNDNFRWLLKQRDVVDFESRKTLVMMLFPEGKDEYEHLHEMLIDRSQLLAESFEYIGQVDAHTLHGGLFMEFKNEEATGPGVLREWFCMVCRAIFNPQNVLFLPCSNDRRRFFPNPGESFPV